MNHISPVLQEMTAFKRSRLSIPSSAGRLEFLTMPHFFELAEVDGRRLIVGYEPLQQDFRVLDVGHTDQFNHLVRMDHSEGLVDDGQHLMEMLQVRRVILQAELASDVLAHLVAKGWGRPPGMS